MKILTVLALIALLASVAGRRRIYTEEEETKYLQQLKQQELREFEQEMKQQSEENKRQYSGSMYGVQLDGGSHEANELPSELRGPVAPWSRKSQRSQQQRIPTQALALKTQSEPEFSLSKIEEPVANTFDNGDHWCYYCATPVDKLKPDMRTSIRKLLDIRRTSFPPKDAITPECLSARNLTNLKKQKCTYKYCQTLSIVDRNAGNSFVVRGCAEHFGAINVPELEKNDDHSCEILHETLAIKECICKSNKYCNAGWSKRSPNSVSQQSHVGFIIVFSVLALLF